MLLAPPRKPPAYSRGSQTRNPEPAAAAASAIVGSVFPGSISELLIEKLRSGSHGLQQAPSSDPDTQESVRIRSWNFCQAESGHKALSSIGCDLAAGRTGGRVRVFYRYTTQRSLASDAPA